MGGVRLSDIQNGFFKPQVDVSHFFGYKKGSKNILLTFREPTEAEFNDLGLASQEPDKRIRMQKLSDLWAKCLKEWTVFKDEGDGPISHQEMVGILRQSAPACYYIVTEWQKQLPLPQRSTSDSVKSLESTSTEET